MRRRRATLRSQPHSSSSRRDRSLGHRLGSSGERDFVSSAVVTVRLPNGDAEFRSIEEPPKPGDHMKCRGADWTVAHVTHNADGSAIVTLMPAQLLPDATA